MNELNRGECSTTLTQKQKQSLFGRGIQKKEKKVKQQGKQTKNINCALALTLCSWSHIYCTSLCVAVANGHY